MRLPDIYKTFHPAAQNTHSSHAHMELSPEYDRKQHQS